MDVLEHLKTALTGRYVVEREIGAGGMATVYLARDVKHDRHVALKVLRPELAAVLGTERFLSEIRVTAHLQHPHLVPLYDSGEVGGLPFYVMPCVEGESLRSRLDRECQLPVDEAVRIAMAVASALDYAHRHGVIHRDLKPENILLQEEQPLVTDFGIALAISKAGGARITQTGLSLGTPQYMSPEQATGDRQIDGRTDIYALGSVLYEMLTGEPPHTGSTVQAIIAKVLTDKPRSVRAARESVPEHVEAAINRALAKLPADRFQTVAQFAEALVNPRVALTTPGTGTAVPALSTLRSAGPIRPSTRLRQLLPWTVAALALGVAGWGWLRRARADATPVRFVVTIPGAERLADVTGSTIAMSRDGSRFVYTGHTTGGQQLLVRSLDQLESRPIPGTDGAAAPFLSPDGKWVAFFADGKLKKVALTGGTPVTLADAPAHRGGSWGDGDVIVFVANHGSGLSRISAGGGRAQVVTTPDSARGEVDQRWPHVLPGGEAALFTSWRSDVRSAQVGVASLKTGEIKLLGLHGTSPQYVANGYLLYAQTDGSLLAAPFDLRRQVATGPATPVLQDVMVKLGGAAAVALGENGTLLYARGSADSRVVLVDRGGAGRPILDNLRAYGPPRFSPDGKRIAFTAGPAAGRDIWVYHAELGTLSRLTFEGDNRYPEWTPDGKRIIFSSDRGRGADIYWQVADGGMPAEPLLAAEFDQSEALVSRDGSVLVYRETRPATGRDIWFIPLHGDRKPRPFLRSRFDDISPRLSPDGRWLTYVSNESGRNEVYVRSFPGPGGRWLVSTGGGKEPVWASDGREIFYRSQGQFVAATVRTTPEFTVTSRRQLFDDTFVVNILVAGYDVHPDGSHFVVLKSASEQPQLIAVLNWLDEWQKRPKNSRG